MTKALSHYSPCCENIFSFFSRQAGTLNPFAFTLQMLGLQAQTALSKLLTILTAAQVI
jgi:hypothetical protein